MKKTAWPTIGDQSESFGFVDTTSGPKDMVMNTQDRYSTLNPSIYLLEEEQLEEGYGEGVISPVDEPFGEEVDKELQSMANDLQIRLIKNANLLVIGNVSSKILEKIYSSNINIYCLNNLKINKKSSLYNENNDLKYFRFNQEFDGFLINLASRKEVGAIIKNAYQQLKPYSSGFIISASDSSEEIIASGLKISWARHNGEMHIYDVVKDELSQLSIAKICKSNDGSAQALIKCKIAKTTNDKVAGLQVYDYLPQDSGLLFNYDHPQSVTYHMGKVAFPIDIIFIDENNKIKKISKNIQPGSLELFSCSEVSNVLEINGGMCDSLGISYGDYIFINDSFNKVASSINTSSSYIGHSSKIESGIYKTANSKYLVVNKNSKIPRNLSSERYIFCDFDSFFDLPIKLSRLDKSGRTSISFDNEPIMVSNNFINYNLLDFLQYKNYKNLENKYALSMYDAIPIINELKENIKNSSIPFDKIVFLSYREPSRLLTAHLLKNAFDNIPNFEFFNLPSSCNTIQKKASAIASRYRINDSEFLISKKAGIPVPDEAKASAKKALDLFSDSLNECKKLVKNFEQNKNVYEKVSGNAEVIKNSKGQYHQSCKRNSDILVKALLGIRDGIRVMNQIKDISYTEELISSLADAAKAMSEGSKEIFELIKIIDMPDFFEKLISKTTEFNNLFEDFSNTLDRMNKFINSDILGVKVLIGD